MLELISQRLLQQKALQYLTMLRVVVGGDTVLANRISKAFDAVPVNEHTRGNHKVVVGNLTLK